MEKELKEIIIDLNKTPFINITWKIEKDLSGIVENSKKGHDFAARVFVVKKTGATALSNRAPLNTQPPILRRPDGSINNW